MTAPFAWMFARLPWVAAISFLVLFTNTLSTFWYQYQVGFHYSLVAVPALSIGTVHALAAIERARSYAIATALVAAVLTAYLWSPVPFGRTEQWVARPNNQWAVAARQIIDEIPADASVAAHYRITPHIAHRREVYQFPTPFRAVLYGANGNVDGPRVIDRAEQIEYVVLSVDTTDYPYDDWLLIRSAFELTASNEFWSLYERDAQIPLP